MDMRPLHLAPSQLEMLREFERLHEQWRVASAAADAIDCTSATGKEVQRLLEYRLAADQVHQKAMQLLRERPI